jgi:nucleotidyltransferase substrate binding protein (TIGR01987 family)
MACSKPALLATNGWGRCVSASVASAAADAIVGLLPAETMLYLDPLSKAIEQLAASLEYGASELAAGDPSLARQFRAAAIQAFEYTFELSRKMLQRRLKEILSDAEVDRLSYRDLIRTGAAKGLIDDPVPWFAFREMRNITSHSYDEVKAEQIAAVLPAFLDKARSLLRELQRSSP